MDAKRAGVHEGKCPQMCPNNQKHLEQCGWTSMAAVRSMTDSSRVVEDSEANRRPRIRVEGRFWRLDLQTT